MRHSVPADHPRTARELLDEQWAIATHIDANGFNASNEAAQPSSVRAGRFRAGDLGLVPLDQAVHASWKVTMNLYFFPDRR